MTDAGLGVVVTPEKTLHLTAEFDMKTARMLTRGPASEDDLVRDLHRSIEEGLRAPGRALTQTVVAAMTRGDVEGAVSAVEDAVRDGAGAFFGDDPDLFAALDQVPDDAARNRPDFLKARLGLGYGLEAWRQLERDARFYLVAARLTGTDRGTIENTVAVALAGQGATEAAKSLWRRLLKTPGALDAGDRGWAWRNLSRTVSPSSAEALSAARASVDAFLEAGDKAEAMRSQALVGELLLQSDTDEALRHYETLLQGSPEEGLMDAEQRAALHHHYARCLNELRRYDEGLAAAKAAVAARETVIGAEDQLVSSLHLAAILARNAGRPDEAAELEERAAGRVAAGHSAHFVKVAPLLSLLEAFDADAAETALADARAQGDQTTILALETLIATHDRGSAHADRIARLELALQSHAQASEAEKRPVRMALALLLEAEEDFSGAGAHYRRILDREPSALEIRDRYIKALTNGGHWTDLTTFLTEEFNRSRDPRIGLVLVDAHLRGGNPKAALEAASLVKEGAVLTPEQREQLDRDRLRAIDLRPVYEASAPRTPLVAPIGRAEIEEALAAFTQHVSGDVRMSFWRASDKKPGDHDWCAGPEQNGQNLLHTFLRGRFRDRINAFQEVGAGAGRIDLFLQFDDALKVIIELKLCGYGKSAVYAAEGSDQLDHYMQARDIYLGYLVVFDARLDDCGQPLDVILPARGTIETFLIDVTPRVSKRSKTPKT